MSKDCSISYFLLLSAFTLSDRWTTISLTIWFLMRVPLIFIMLRSARLPMLVRKLTNVMKTFILYPTCWFTLNYTWNKETVLSHNNHWTHPLNPLLPSCHESIVFPILCRKVPSRRKTWVFSYSTFLFAFWVFLLVRLQCRYFAQRRAYCESIWGSSIENYYSEESSFRRFQPAYFWVWVKAATYGCSLFPAWTQLRLSALASW